MTDSPPSYNQVFPVYDSSGQEYELDLTQPYHSYLVHQGTTFELPSTNKLKASDLNLENGAYEVVQEEGEYCLITSSLSNPAIHYKVGLVTKSPPSLEERVRLLMERVSLLEKKVDPSILVDFKGNGNKQLCNKVDKDGNEIRYVRFGGSELSSSSRYLSTSAFLQEKIDSCRFDFDPAIVDLYMKANRSFDFLHSSYRKIKKLSHLPMVGSGDNFRIKITKPLPRSLEPFWSSGYMTEAQFEKLITDFIPVNLDLTHHPSIIPFWWNYYEELFYKFIDFMEDLEEIENQISLLRETTSSAPTVAVQKRILTYLDNRRIKYRTYDSS